MIDQLEFLIRNIPNLLFGFPGYRPGGLSLSLLLTLLAIGAGFPIAIIVSQGLDSQRLLFRRLARLYVWVLRGIPLILLLLLVHQMTGGLRIFGLDRRPIFSAVIALTLYCSAYQASILLAGMRAIPKRLVESARLMGTKSGVSSRAVKLRYALHVMLPAFVGQSISMFKDTSVVIVLGVAELMTVARIILGSDASNAANWVSLYLFVGAFYFAVAFTFSRFAAKLERRQRNQDLIYSLSNY